MIPTFIVLALSCFAAFYVARSLKEGAASARVDEGASLEAEDDKRLALAALIDLEEERDSGKLSRDDFERLRTTYEVEAVDALRRADAATDDGDEDDLEQEIARVRDRLRCPRCGAIRPSGELCPRCES